MSDSPEIPQPAQPETAAGMQANHHQEKMPEWAIRRAELLEHQRDEQGDETEKPRTQFSEALAANFGDVQAAAEWKLKELFGEKAPNIQFGIKGTGEESGETKEVRFAEISLAGISESTRQIELRWSKDDQTAQEGWELQSFLTDLGIAAKLLLDQYKDELREETFVEVAQPDLPVKAENPPAVATDAPPAVATSATIPTSPEAPNQSFAESHAKDNKEVGVAVVKYLKDLYGDRMAKFKISPWKRPTDTTTAPARFISVELLSNPGFVKEVDLTWEVNAQTNESGWELPQLLKHLEQAVKEVFNKAVEQGKEDSSVVYFKSGGFIENGPGEGVFGSTSFAKANEALTNTPTEKTGETVTVKLKFTGPNNYAIDMRPVFPMSGFTVDRKQTALDGGYVGTIRQTDAQVEIKGAHYAKFNERTTQENLGTIIVVKAVKDAKSSYSSGGRGDPLEDYRDKLGFFMLRQDEKGKLGWIRLAGPNAQDLEIPGISERIAVPQEIQEFTPTIPEPAKN